MAGTDPDRLTWRDWCDVVEATLIDLVDGFVNRHEVIDDVAKALLRPPWNDRKSWGTDPTAAAGQRAMMDLAGAPARTLTEEEREARRAARAARIEGGGGDR